MSGRRKASAVLSVAGCAVVAILSAEVGEPLVGAIFTTVAIAVTVTEVYVEGIEKGRGDLRDEVLTYLDRQKDRCPSCGSEVFMEAGDYRICACCGNAWRKREDETDEKETLP